MRPAANVLPAFLLYEVVTSLQWPLTGFPYLCLLIIGIYYSMMFDITSPQNPRIKSVMRLQSKQSERREQNLIVVEGFREIGLAIKAGFESVELFVAPDVCDSERWVLLQNQFPKTFTLSGESFARLAYRESSDGFIALFRPRYFVPGDFTGRINPVFIVLEGVEKPGNLGAVLRTADAARADAVWLCDTPTDIYNPNAIRSSVGCIFTVPVLQTSSTEALQWFRENGVVTLAAALTAKEEYHLTDLTGPVALVFGTEATGLSDLWLHKSDKQILIPMRGQIDSLNVSISAAVMVFEAMRQRNFIS